MLTDNAVLVKNTREFPALMCVQRNAAKKISSEDDFIKSNIDSFGNAIGAITNRATSMYEVRSRFDKGSKEYKTLSYRIRCCQQAQQDEIDRAKGIISKPMPKAWYDRHTVNKIEDENIKHFYRTIVADKKPYFMRYIYPDLMKQYNTYIKNTDRKALREFQMTVEEMVTLPYNELSEKQRDFLQYYEYRMPVGTGNCVMNKICRRFEEEFDGCVGKHNASVEFDYSFMKSSEKYSNARFYSIKRLYESYNERLKNYKVLTAGKRVDNDEKVAKIIFMNDEFRRECSEICPSESVLCNILLDICYPRSSTKRFAWAMCPHTIIQNLLAANNNAISYPMADVDGGFIYCGNKYSVNTKEMGLD